MFLLNKSVVSDRSIHPARSLPRNCGAVNQMFIIIIADILLNRFFSQKPTFTQPCLVDIFLLLFFWLGHRKMTFLFFYTIYWKFMVFYTIFFLNSLSSQSYAIVTNFDDIYSVSQKLMTTLYCYRTKKNNNNQKLMQFT